MRVYEPSGRRGTGTITVDPVFGSAREVTMLEDDDSSLPEVLRSDGGAVQLPVLPFQVRTLRFDRLPA